jgi:hypothetical protein
MPASDSPPNPPVRALDFRVRTNENSRMRGKRALGFALLLVVAFILPAPPAAAQSLNDALAGAVPGVIPLLLLADSHFALHVSN